jgi:cupin superfamily acireductone dioxygenase involved in methionine salvage
METTQAVFVDGDRDTAESASKPTLQPRIQDLLDATPIYHSHRDSNIRYWVGLGLCSYHVHQTTTVPSDDLLLVPDNVCP